MKTYNEIITALIERDISVYDFAYNNVWFAPNEEEEVVDETRNKWVETNPSPNYQTEPELFQEWVTILNRQFPYRTDELARKRVLGDLHFKQVTQEGGEGQGDHWYSVNYFPALDIYIMTVGYYQSHQGTEFYGGYEECCSQVKPAEKTITVYEPV